MLCRALIVTALFSLGLVALPTAAGACQCDDSAFGPPKVLFQGRATEVVGEGHLVSVWSFDVMRVIRGEVADPQSAEVHTGGEASCGLQAAPVVAGAMYEVGAPLGETASGEPRLYVGLCGGSLRQLSDAEPEVAAPARDESSSGDWPWLVLTGLVVVGGGGVLLARRARRTGAPA